MKDLNKLVEKIKSDDKKAFEELYKITAPELYWYCLRICGNEYDAKDLLQEVYLNAWQKINQYNGTNFSAWLHSIAHNLRINERKRKKDEVFSEEEFIEFSEDESFSPENQTDNRIQHEEIIKIIDESLTELQRETVLMYYYDDKSVNEIADALGCSENVIKARLHRARKKLHDELKNKNILSVSLPALLKCDAEKADFPDTLKLLGKSISHKATVSCIQLPCIAGIFSACAIIAGTAVTDIGLPECRAVDNSELTVCNACDTEENNIEEVTAMNKTINTIVSSVFTTAVLASSVPPTDSICADTSLELTGTSVTTQVPETNDFDFTDESDENAPTFKDFDFIWDAIKKGTEFMEENIDTAKIYVISDRLNLENYSESYVEVVAGDEESAEKFLDAMAENGLDTNIFRITINPEGIVHDIAIYTRIGDINEDGEITADDALLILQSITGNMSRSVIGNADVDSDGEITSNDALAILNMIVDDEKSVPDTKEKAPSKSSPNKKTDSENPETADTAQDEDVYVYYPQFFSDDITIKLKESRLEKFLENAQREIIRIENTDNEDEPKYISKGTEYKNHYVVSIFLLGYDDEGYAVIGDDLYDVLEGFDENGEPIIGKSQETDLGIPSVGLYLGKIDGENVLGGLYQFLIKINDDGKPEIVSFQSQPDAE